MIWEQLAHEAEAKAISERSIIPYPEGIDAPYFEQWQAAFDEAALKHMQAVAEQLPKSEIEQFIVRGEEAAKKIDLDEAETRALIDQQLRDSGWEADTKSLRMARDTTGKGPQSGHCRMADRKRPRRLCPVRRLDPRRRCRSKAATQERLGCHRSG